MKPEAQGHVGGGPLALLSPPSRLAPPHIFLVPDRSGFLSHFQASLWKSSFLACALRYFTVETMLSQFQATKNNLPGNPALPLCPGGPGRSSSCWEAFFH